MFPHWYDQTSLLSSSKTWLSRKVLRDWSSSKASCEMGKLNRVSRSSADITLCTLMLGSLAKEYRLGKRSASTSSVHGSSQNVTARPSPMEQRAIIAVGSILFLLKKIRLSISIVSHGSFVPLAGHPRQVQWVPLLRGAAKPAGVTTLA